MTDYQRGTIFGAVIVGLAFAFALSRPQEQPRAADRQAEPAQVGGDRHKLESFWEKTTSDPTAFFTLCLVTVGGVQAGFFVWQLDLIRRGLADTKEAADASKEQAKLARESLIASNRAWIKIMVKPGSSLLIAETGAHLSVSVKLENIGNSVARDIRCAAWLIAPKTREAGFHTPVSALTEHRLLCAKSRNTPTGQGFMLFPGEHFPKEQRFSDYAVGATMSPENIEKHAIRVDSGHRGIPLSVGGAVNYRFPSDDKVHQSSFLFELTYKDMSVAFDLATELVDAEHLGFYGIVEGDGRQAD